MLRATVNSCEEPAISHSRVAAYKVLNAFVLIWCLDQNERTSIIYHDCYTSFHEDMVREFIEKF